MLVCHCHGISDRHIRRAVRAGAVTPGQVAMECGAGGRCGGCTRAVEEIVRSELRVSAVESASIPWAPAPAR